MISSNGANGIIANKEVETQGQSQGGLSQIVCSFLGFRDIPLLEINLRDHKNQGGKNDSQNPSS